MFVLSIDFFLLNLLAYSLDLLFNAATTESMSELLDTWHLLYSPKALCEHTHEIIKLNTYLKIKAVKTICYLKIAEHFSYKIYSWLSAYKKSKINLRSDIYTINLTYIDLQLNVTRLERSSSRQVHLDVYTILIRWVVTCPYYVNG